MKKILTSLLLLGTSVVCSNANADSVDVYGTYANLYADNIPTQSQWTLDVKNGYVSVFGYDSVRNTNFACSIWYTNTNFTSMKETALAFINAEPHSNANEYPSIRVTRDASGTCTEMWFLQQR